jgi:hypothetical protein
MQKLVILKFEEANAMQTGCISDTTAEVFENSTLFVSASIDDEWKKAISDQE